MHSQVAQTSRNLKGANTCRINIGACPIHALDCKYHVVFVPKGRRTVLYGKIRPHLGTIFHALARQKECQIVEGHIMSDHVHMMIRIPPKYAVSAVIGFLKGKSAIAIARQFSGRVRNFNGENFFLARLRSFDRRL